MAPRRPYIAAQDMHTAQPDSGSDTEPPLALPPTRPRGGMSCTLNTPRLAHAVACCIYGVVAAAAATVVLSSGTHLIATVTSRRAVGSESTDVSIQGMLIAANGVSTGLHLIEYRRATRYRRHAARMVAWPRWIDFAITGAIVAVAIDALWDPRVPAQQIAMRAAQAVGASAIGAAMEASMAPRYVSGLLAAGIVVVAAPLAADAVQWHEQPTQPPIATVATAWVGATAALVPVVVALRCFSLARITRSPTAADASTLGGDTFDDPRVAYRVWWEYPAVATAVATKAPLCLFVAVDATDPAATAAVVATTAFATVVTFIVTYFMLRQSAATNTALMAHDTTMSMLLVGDEV